ncbi:hypothetical protein V1525DRAFT_405842 [Lipomyces kononenkoae]|uniref:Uncharacterized protein n=1 Tax=Lipomyces kononenkoae TaxID=34357 RepID=A0ACC3SYW7_LIPKO
MAANYAATYGFERSGPGPTAVLQGQPFPATMQYEAGQPSTQLSSQPVQMQMQMQLSNQQQQQQQQQQRQQRQQWQQWQQLQEQQLQQSFIQQNQRYLAQQAPDPLPAAFLADHPSAAQSMFSTTPPFNSNDYNTYHDATNSNNTLHLDLLANDLASSVSAALTADVVLCPPSPNHHPPDLSKVQRISEQYMRTGDAPYIASAALFPAGWEGLEAWRQPVSSQLSHLSSMQQSYHMPASQSHNQDFGPPNNRQLTSLSSPPAFNTGVQVHQGTNDAIVHNIYRRPQQPQNIQLARPQRQAPQVEPHFQQQSQISMLAQQLQQQRSLPERRLWQQPSPPQQLQQQRPENSFEYSKIRWSDVQASILNAPPAGTSPLQATGFVSDAGDRLTNQLTPVSTAESPVIVSTWRGSPVSDAQKVGLAISASHSPITPGRASHPHHRAASVSAHTSVPLAQNMISPAFRGDGIDAQVVTTTSGPTSKALQASYNIHQPSVAVSGQLNTLSQSTDEPSAGSTPRGHLQSRNDLKPSAIAKVAEKQQFAKEKAPTKRKDVQTSVLGGPPKKTKEEIQAQKAAAKEEKARARAEKQKLQREQAEQKKREQAMKRAREEQVMKEIREKLALEDQEKERASAVADQARAKESESDNGRKIESNGGGNQHQNIAIFSSATPPEVSLYPDTQAEVLYAQRELLKEALCRQAPQQTVVNTPQFKPRANPGNARNEVTSFVATEQTQTPPSASPFVYHVRPPASTSHASNSTIASATVADTALNLSSRNDPLFISSKTDTTTLEDNDENTTGQRTPAQMPLKTLESTANSSKKLRKPAVAPQSRNMQDESNSRVKSLSPGQQLPHLSQSGLQQLPSKSPSRTFPHASQHTAQPSSVSQFSSPPEATSTPVNQRTSHVLPNPIIFAGPTDVPLQQQFSQQSTPTVELHDQGQTKRTFMSMDDVDSVNERKEDNDLMGLDLEYIFGAGENADSTFHDAQRPLTIGSSSYGIGNGMIVDEDKVLGNVLGKVEEWSRSLKWDIDEEAMRLAGPSSISGGESQS